MPFSNLILKANWEEEVRLVRSRLRFIDFVWLLKGGFWIGLIAGFFIFLFITLFASSSINESQIKNDFYTALRGEKSEDKIANKTADLMIKIHKSEPIPPDQFRDAIEVLSEETERTHLKMIVKEWDNVNMILENSPEAQNITVNVIEWSRVFIVEGIIFWIILSISFSISYLFGSEESSRRRDNRNILTYPWNKFWALPFTLIMLPLIVFGQPILLIIYAIRSIRQGTRHEIPPERQEEITPIVEHSEIRPQQSINKDRAKYRREVGLVRKKTKNSRQQWIVLCSQRLAIAKTAVEKEIRQHRDRLIDIGRDMENSQRNFSGAKAQLKTIEQAIANNTSGATDCELGIEFDRLLEVPEILAIDVHPGEISVYTSTLFVTSPWGKFELGDYVIQINTETDMIKVKNSCNTSACGRNHPYSYGRDPQICFGNLSDYLGKLQKKQEFFGLIVSLLQALQANEGDHPEHVKHWKGVA